MVRLERVATNPAKYPLEEASVYRPVNKIETINKALIASHASHHADARNRVYWKLRQRGIPRKTITPVHLLTITKLNCAEVEPPLVRREHQFKLLCFRNLNRNPLNIKETFLILSCSQFSQYYTHCLQNNKVHLTTPPIHRTKFYKVAVSMRFRPVALSRAALLQP